MNVTRRGPLTLLGQLSATRNLSPNLPFYSDKPPFPSNLVQVWDDKFVQSGMDDAQSAVLLIAPSFNASLIGAGPTGAPLQPLFGSSDFKVYNVDFQNRAVSKSAVSTVYGIIETLIHSRPTLQSRKRWSRISPMQMHRSTDVLSQVSRTHGIQGEMEVPTLLIVSSMVRQIVST